MTEFRFFTADFFSSLLPYILNCIFTFFQNFDCTNTLTLNKIFHCVLLCNTVTSTLFSWKFLFFASLTLCCKFLLFQSFLKILFFYWAVPPKATHGKGSTTPKEDEGRVFEDRDMKTMTFLDLDANHPIWVNQIRISSDSDIFESLTEQSLKLNGEAWSVRRITI